MSMKPRTGGKLVETRQKLSSKLFESRFGRNRERLTQDESWSKVAEFPFASTVQQMSVIFVDKANKERFVFTKGAVERIIGSCNRVPLDRSAEPGIEMSENFRNRILDNMEALAAQGLRVLGLASKAYLGETGGNDTSYDPFLSPPAPPFCAVVSLDKAPITRTRRPRGGSLGSRGV
ncbi:MAG: hypothetical protein Q9182_002167 [Xanthomendoza sp. 2 TL-2023]